MAGHKVADWTTRNHSLETLAGGRGRSRLFHRSLVRLENFFGDKDSEMMSLSVPTSMAEDKGSIAKYTRHLCILNRQEEMAYPHLFFKQRSALAELARSFHKVYSPSLAMWSYEETMLSHHRSLDSPSRPALR